MTQIIYAAINWLARYPHGRVGVLVLNLSGKANGAQTPREKFALDRAFALIDGPAPSPPNPFGLVLSLTFRVREIRV